MKVIITGDIIDSTKLDEPQRKILESELWTILKQHSSTEDHFYLSRGDAFQLKVDEASAAFSTALSIRCHLKSLDIAPFLLDARISLGLGEISLEGKTLSSSDGSAFQRSGRGLDALKDRALALAISTGIPHFDKAFDALCFLADEHIRNWSKPQAEAILLRMQNQTFEQIGKKLQINTSAAYKRVDAAHWKAVSKVDDFYRFVTDHLKS